MPKIAVIDIGSNTIHMDLFQASKNRVTFKEGKGIFNKLGVYLSKDGVIPPKKLKESLEILKRLKVHAKKKGANTVLVFGTSILRKAKNKKDFVQKALAECNLSIDIVSGERESSYLEKVARKKMHIRKGKTLLVDIGGGSTELVILNQRKTFFRKSYPYGLSKVKGKFKIDNFRDLQKGQQLTKYFNQKVKQFLKESLQKKTIKIIGFSSVVKTFGLMKYTSIKKLGDFSGKKVTLRDLIGFQKKLSRNPRSVKIESHQKDLAFIGTFFFISLFRLMGIQQVEISPYSIREGYLIEYLEK